MDDSGYCVSEGVDRGKRGADMLFMKQPTGANVAPRPVH
jgi:hypothetical protein